MKKNAFSITTAIPYVNAKPHLGHVLEWFQADALARYHTLKGETVSFTSGADENSLKNVQAAEKAGKHVQDWLDEYAGIFQDAYKEFGIELTGFRRGSDQEKHWPGVQQLWKKCVEKGDVYKKTYTGLYCIGCEAFYTPDELVDGKCPEHLTAPEEVTEENYFFKLSNYQKQLEELISSDTVAVYSDQFKQEVLGFIRHGLEDFSISRSSSRSRGIGVPVPNDESQVMYVWFDALAIYMTAIGYGYSSEEFENKWPVDVHVIGKGIVRFHAVYWIGMLLSADLPLPKCVHVHGYITADGQKMSKSLGNVIDPFELIKKYPLETVRYYLLAQIPTFSDGDFSYTRFEESYTAHLANGIGNLCSRIAKLCEKSEVEIPESNLEFSSEFVKLMDKNQIDLGIKWVFEQVSYLDQYLAKEEPWKKSGEEQKTILKEAAQSLRYIAFHLQPFMPETATQILKHFNTSKISAVSPLFPRL